LDKRVPELPPFRPPSESYSLLIRATRNCPWNRCAFCGMYKTERFSIRSKEEVKDDIRFWKSYYNNIKELSWMEGYGGKTDVIATKYGITFLLEGSIKSIFIGDSDSLIMKVDEFADILQFLRETFPDVERITSYARTNTILRKKMSDLKRFREAGLTRVHIGLESGDNEVLQYIKKGVTRQDAIEAGIKAKEAGFEVSEYVIIGIGGRQRWKHHAENTAKVLNQISPDFIRVRTFFPIPGTEIHSDIINKRFFIENSKELIEEEILLIENLECNSTFLSDHVSNLVNVEGRLPFDKEDMLGYLKHKCSPEGRI